MAIKQRHDKRNPEADPKATSKKARKGFVVGPANLPDGTYRRKVQKIKHDLIRKAKVKKSYNKIKERQHLENPTGTTITHAIDDSQSTTLELHPERQAMLDKPETEVQDSPKTIVDRQRGQRNRRSKPVPFEKEARLAQQRKEEVEARQRTFEENNRQRLEKIEERERFRKAMTKARVGGKNGQRKLGRESKVLLEKVKRVMRD